MEFAMAHAKATKSEAGKGGPPSSRRGLTRSGEVRAAPTAVYSRPGFCKAHGISEAFYHKLKNQGLGPDELHLGSRVLITFESAARWRAEREKATESAE
jgi:hypothetical protein